MKIRTFWHDNALMVEREDGMVALAADTDVNDATDSEDAVVGPDSWAPTIDEALA